jgi:uncharacterized protein YjeT (DUF2065 family)
MPVFASVLSALFAGIGAIAMFWPSVMSAAAQYLVTPNGLLAAAAVRVVFGGSLILAAPDSKAPTTLRVIGAVVVIAGLATPLLGPTVANNLIADWSTDGGARFRVFGTVAVVLGCWLVWLLTPRGGRHIAR